MIARYKLWSKDAQRIDLAGVLIMGSVKPSYIKNFARDLLRTYESSFSPDFEQNKLRVSEYTDIKNKTIKRNLFLFESFCRFDFFRRSLFRIFFRFG